MATKRLWSILSDLGKSKGTDVEALEKVVFEGSNDLAELGQSEYWKEETSEWYFRRANKSGIEGVKFEVEGLNVMYLASAEGDEPASEMLYIESGNRTITVQMGLSDQEAYSNNVTIEDKKASEALGKLDSVTGLGDARDYFRVIGRNAVYTHPIHTEEPGELPIVRTILSDLIE